jgi:ketosteroid isomerase-like protein
VEQSQELVALMNGMYDAMRAGDVAAFEEAALGDVLVIGSDPDEWWSGRDTAVAAFRAQTEAMGGGFPVQPGNPVAYEHGDVGWIADRPSMPGPDGSSLPVRISVVTVRQGGDWKIAQMHFSIGVANEEVVGQELPI